MNLSIDGKPLPNANRETIDGAIAHLNLIRAYEKEGADIQSVDVHKIWDGHNKESLIIKVDYKK